MARLDDLQLDALREMGNIGAGNAATALSQLVGSTVSITIPQIKLLPLSQVAAALGGADQRMHVIYAEVKRQLTGTMLLILSPESAEIMVNSLVDKPAQFSPEMGASALSEIGSILCGAYLSALSELVGVSAVASVPAMAVDMLGALLDFMLIEIGDVADEVFLLETELEMENRRLVCSQLFLPNPETLALILKTLGV